MTIIIMIVITILMIMIMIVITFMIFTVVMILTMMFSSVCRQASNPAGTAIGSFAAAWSGCDCSR